MHSQTESKNRPSSLRATSASSLMSAKIWWTPSGATWLRLPRFSSQTSQPSSLTSLRTMAALMVPVPPMNNAFMERYLLFFI